MVCITDTEDGGQFGIAGDGIAYFESPSPQWRFQFSNITDPSKRIGIFTSFETPKNLKLSMIVAASGAFPGAFDPVAIDHLNRSRLSMPSTAA